MNTFSIAAKNKNKRISGNLLAYVHLKHLALQFDMLCMSYVAKLKE